MPCENLPDVWSDWIDYWSVDYNFENKKEIVKVKNKETGEFEEQWTGDYIFENEFNNNPYYGLLQNYNSKQTDITYSGENSFGRFL